jgi:hypothetical protein
MFILLLDKLDDRALETVVCRRAVDPGRVVKVRPGPAKFRGLI